YSKVYRRNGSLVTFGADKEQLDSRSQARDYATDDQDFLLEQLVTIGILFLIGILVEGFEDGRHSVPLGERLDIENILQSEEVLETILVFVVQQLGNLPAVLEHRGRAGRGDELVEILNHTFDHIARHKELA